MPEEILAPEASFTVPCSCGGTAGWDSGRVTLDENGAIATYRLWHKTAASFEVRRFTEINLALPDVERLLRVSLKQHVMGTHREYAIPTKPVPRANASGAFLCSCGKMLYWDAVRDEDAAIVGYNLWHGYVDGANDLCSDYLDLNVGTPGDKSVYVGEAYLKARLELIAERVHARERDRERDTMDDPTTSPNYGSDSQQCECGGYRGWVNKLVSQEVYFWHTSAAAAGPVMKRERVVTFLDMERGKLTPQMRLESWARSCHALDENERASARTNANVAAINRARYDDAQYVTAIVGDASIEVGAMVGVDARGEIVQAGKGTPLGIVAAISDDGEATIQTRGTTSLGGARVDLTVDTAKLQRAIDTQVDEQIKAMGKAAMEALKNDPTPISKLLKDERRPLLILPKPETIALPNPAIRFPKLADNPAIALAPEWAENAKACSCGGAIFWESTASGDMRMLHASATDYVLESTYDARRRRMYSTLDQMFSAFAETCHDEETNADDGSRDSALYDGVTYQWEESPGSEMSYTSKRAPDRIKDKTFVVTGILSNYDRRGVDAEIRKHGGIFDTRVTLNTSALVVGTKPGQTKIDAARRYGIPMISDSDFTILVAREIAIANAAPNEVASLPPARAMPRSPSQFIDTQPVRPISRPNPNAPRTVVDIAALQEEAIEQLTEAARVTRKRREL